MKKKLSRPVFGFNIRNKEGVIIYGSNTDILDLSKKMSDTCKKNNQIKIKISYLCNLVQGDYFISVGIVEKNKKNDQIIPLDRRYDSIHYSVISNKSIFGFVDMNIDMKIENFN